MSKPSTLQQQGAWQSGIELKAESPEAFGPHGVLSSVVGHVTLLSAPELYMAERKFRGHSYKVVFIESGHIHVLLNHQVCTGAY